MWRTRRFADPPDRKMNVVGLSTTVNVASPSLSALVRFAVNEGRQLTAVTSYAVSVAFEISKYRPYPSERQCPSGD
jgi:hypothetical protein